MITYRSTKAGFIQDAVRGIIADRVREEYEKHIGKANSNEIRSWANSLRYMAKTVDTPMIHDDAAVCIEYRLPNSGHRIDFIIAGQDASGRDNVVIVELKQWQEAEVIEDRRLLSTYLAGGNRMVAHPSYQAWSYAVTLENYNEAVEDGRISLFPCAYLHNYVFLEGDKINDSSLFPEIRKAPLFFSDESERLRSFIVSCVSSPDSRNLMDAIDNGRLRPSKSLQDAVGSMLRGSREFVLLDDQKVFFEDIMAYVKRARLDDRKHVFIVEGGPGTGKSVLAINLLAESVKMGLMAAYVSKNAAPRNVYESILVKNDKFRKALVNKLFIGSGRLLSVHEDAYDALFVDESHRLNAKSGMFHNEGENQIKEIINASRVSVFLLDEKQKITSYDIGSIAEIRGRAEEAGAVVHQGRLSSQFRCNGSDGYLSFIDDVLDISHGYYTFDPEDYDIEVMDDPAAMMDRIRMLNKRDNKARMLAGYCWNWVSKKNPELKDIVLSDCGFSAAWNFGNTKTWAIDEGSVEQIGCIHTSQGLEFSYAGVIIGDDLRYENGRVITDYARRAKTDKSLSGLVGRCKDNDREALAEADAIIRNTYRTLLSRAMKGCYVYCTDKALADHLRNAIEENRRRVEAFYGNAVAEPKHS